MRCALRSITTVTLDPPLMDLVTPSNNCCIWKYGIRDCQPEQLALRLFAVAKSSLCGLPGLIRFLRLAGQQLSVMAVSY